MRGACPGKVVRMITCTSERSGLASIGVCRTAKTPQAVRRAVAINTTNRFAIDQRMTAANIALLASGGDSHEDVVAVLVRSRAQFELDGVALLEALELRSVFHREAHLHRRPLDGWDRVVFQLDAAFQQIDSGHFAAPFVEHLFRGHTRSSLARTFEPRECRTQARLRVDQKLAGDDHPVARLEPFADLTVAARVR